MTFPTIAMPSYGAELVYFIQAENGAVKIGRSRDLANRLADLQVGCPIELRLVGWLPQRRWNEKTLHYLFRGQAIRGEWFRVDPYLAVLINGLRELESGSRRLALYRSFIDRCPYTVSTAVFHEAILL